MNRTVTNIFSLTSGQIINSVLTIVIFGYITRLLSIEEFGTFNYLLAIIGITAKIGDFGFGPIVFRECSKENDCKILISSTLIFRFALLVGLSIILMTIIYFGSSVNIFIILFLLINIIFSAKYTNFRDILNIPFKKELKMHIPMAIVIADSLFLLTLLYFLSSSSISLSTFVIFYTIANIPGFITIFILVMKRYNIKLRFSKSKTKWLIKQAAPLSGFVILSVVYLQMDIFMLQLFKSEFEVGLYSASVRLTRPLVMIPAAFVTTFIPLLALKLNNQKDLHELVRNIMKFLFLISFGISSIFIFKSTEITTLIFGEKYISAGTTTVYLFLVLIFLFQNFFLLDLLTLLNLQKFNLYYILIMVGTGIFFNVLLIPILSIEGAAIARILSAFIGFGFLLRILKGRVSLHYLLNWKMFVFIITILAINFLMSETNIILYFAVSCSIFVSLVFVFKILTISEIRDYVSIKSGL